MAVGISSKLFIWQIASGKLLSIQQRHFQPITNIKFSTDGDFILVGGQDGMLVAYLVGDVVSVVTNFMEQSEIGQAEPVYVKSDHSMPIRDIHIGKLLLIFKTITIFLRLQDILDANLDLLQFPVIRHVGSTLLSVENIFLP